MDLLTGRDSSARLLRLVSGRSGGDIARPLLGEDMTHEDLKNWIGSDWLKVDHLVDLLHEVLTDDGAAELMRREVEAYNDRCKEEGAA